MNSPILHDSGLAGGVAIVTGGSRGIGRAIVASPGRGGMDVIFTYRDNAAAAAEVIAQSGSQRLRRSKWTCGTRGVRRHLRKRSLIAPGGLICWSTTPASSATIRWRPGGRGHAHGAGNERERHIQHDARGRALHDFAAARENHQHQFGVRRKRRARPDELCREQRRDQRLHPLAGGRSRAPRTSPSTRSRPASSRPKCRARCAKWPATRSIAHSVAPHRPARRSGLRRLVFSSRYADYITGQVLHVDGGFKME